MNMGKQATIGELYDPAMQITDQAEATAYFQQLVNRQMQFFGRTRAEAEIVERQNLGYYAGYYDHETMRRVQTLFGAAHPIFGAAL